MTKEFKELLDQYIESTSAVTLWLHEHVCKLHSCRTDCPLYDKGCCLSVSCSNAQQQVQKAMDAMTLDISEDGTAEGAEHYKSCPIQPIDMMSITLSHDEFAGFLKGNIIKYALRAGHKGAAEKDLKKMEQYKRWYYQFLDMGFVDVPEPEVKVKSLTGEDTSDDK